MLINFFYTLRECNVPVSPTAFLTLHRAMQKGLVGSLEDLYVTARTILVKREKHFDIYDRVFQHIFAGCELPSVDEEGLELLAESMLDEWLKNPKSVAGALGVKEEDLAAMSPSDLLDYFRERLKDQEGRHDGGSKWIGTGGTSPVGHSGYHPGGLRVGGLSNSRSAVKIAGERRYRNYSSDQPLSQATVGEALKRLRNLVPHGVRDELDLDETLYRTGKNGGEIELVFGRRLVDRLKVVLAIDNGGWSMEPHIEAVQSLFGYASGQFKDLRTLFFHNTIYDLLWEDPTRYRKPITVIELGRLDPDTCLIIVGDASMAPYELMATDGSIYAFERSGRPSIEQLRYLSETFPKSIWLNPVAERQWPYVRTIHQIQQIFPMFPLTLDGLEKGVQYLLQH